MRIDRLLCCLRFAKTRSKAAAIVGAGHIRCNGQRVAQASHPVPVGATLTLPWSKSVRIVKIEQLPERRGSAIDARQCYTELDPAGETELAAIAKTIPEGPLLP